MINIVKMNMLIILLKNKEMIIKMIIRMIKLILMIPISLIFMNNQIQTQTFHIQKIVTKKIYLLMTIISTIHKIEIKQILIVDKDISMVL